MCDGKVGTHPFSRRGTAIATMYERDRFVGPFLKKDFDIELGSTLHAYADALGTFTGEASRPQVMLDAAG